MTRLSRTFNRKVELWESTSTPDGFGGSTIDVSLVGELWANVREVFYENLDVVGLSQNRTEKIITVRRKGLDTNSNIFFIGDQAYQINDIRENYKKTQYECFCSATNFEKPSTPASTVLLIGDSVLTISGSVLTI